ncbi:ATP-binding protein [Nocardia sp. NBC_01503]|uniref:AAA family ATPase n=1 Tax=Nocardia sp. NBC_01503 TaxID=2975997 RepID=UPI002E7C54DA|nr:AAA family ATPase [Nocardia sp. NBC_01503]WTL34403.1 ATP-binding protein [Nocardia sp. NBC_01503]
MLDLTTNVGYIRQIPLNSLAKQRISIALTAIACSLAPRRNHDQSDCRKVRGDMTDDPCILSIRTREELRHAVEDLTTGVIVVCGFPAVGKSSGVRMLAADRDALVLDKDSFAPALEEAVMTELTGNPFDRDSAIYRRVVGPHIYDALVRNALAIGRHQIVVVDAPFIEYVMRARSESCSLAGYLCAKVDHPVSVRTVWMSASPEVIHTRIVRRGAERDRPKLADWAVYRSAVLDSGVDLAAQEVVDAVVVN